MTTFKSLQAPGKVGHFGPRLCLKHFSEDDVIRTKIGGVRLKPNACPLSTSSNPNVVTNDMILVSGQGIHIPTNTSLMAAISPIMKDILYYNHEHYEENTKMLLQDYSTETIEAFLELVHLENVCLTGPQLDDIRNLISDLGIDQDFFSVSPIEDTSEYLSRYLSNGESSAVTFPDQEDSSLSKEVERSLMKEKVKCPFDSCGLEYTTRRLFFKHLVNTHMHDELMKQIPQRGEDGVTKCPFQDCNFESKSPDQRCMLDHYSIIHKIVDEKFVTMFPNHCYSHANKAKRKEKSPK